MIYLLKMVISHSYVKYSNQRVTKNSWKKWARLKMGQNPNVRTLEQGKQYDYITAGFWLWYYIYICVCFLIIGYCMILYGAQWFIVATDLHPSSWVPQKPSV